MFASPWCNLYSAILSEVRGARRRQHIHALRPTPYALRRLNMACARGHTRRIVIGIDGGGTKTTGVVFDETGTLLAERQEGGANVQVLGPDALAARIVPFVRSLERQVGSEADAYCLALAGAGRPEDQEGVRDAAERSGLQGILVVTSDAEAALEGAHGGKPGIVLIAGTGSIVFGRDQDGRTVRAGGWGYLLDDAGSGHDIGKRALIACLRASDGRGARTALAGPVLRALTLDSWEGLVRRTYEEGLGQEEIAALAPLVFRTARDGDDVSRQIIQAAGRELGLLVLALLRRLELGETPRVSPIGGVFREREMLLPPLISEVEGAGYSIHIVSPRFPPAIGAGLLAARRGGVGVTEAMLTNLETHIR